MDDMTAVIRGMPNWKAVGPDFLSAEMLNIDHPEFIRYVYNLLVNVWRTGDAPQQLKKPFRCFIKRGIVMIATTTVGFRLLPLQAMYC